MTRPEPQLNVWQRIAVVLILAAGAAVVLGLLVGGAVRVWEWAI